MDNFEENRVNSTKPNYRVTSITAGDQVYAGEEWTEDGETVVFIKELGILVRSVEGTGERLDQLELKIKVEVDKILKMEGKSLHQLRVERLMRRAGWVVGVFGDKIDLERLRDNLKDKVNKVYLSLDNPSSRVDLVAYLMQTRVALTEILSSLGLRDVALEWIVDCYRLKGTNDTTLLEKEIDRQIREGALTRILDRSIPSVVEPVLKKL